MNDNKCPGCESELELCTEHQNTEIAIDNEYDRGSAEWYEAMKIAGLA